MHSYLFYFLQTCTSTSPFPLFRSCWLIAAPNVISMFSRHINCPSGLRPDYTLLSCLLSPLCTWPIHSFQSFTQSYRSCFLRLPKLAATIFPFALFYQPSSALLNHSCQQSSCRHSRVRLSCLSASCRRLRCMIFYTRYHWHNL
jgi:hypothetical protein